MPGGRTDASATRCAPDHCGGDFLVDPATFGGGIGPSQSLDVDHAVPSKGLAKGGVPQDGHNFVGHGLGIPEVALQRVGQHFAGA